MWEAAPRSLYTALRDYCQKEPEPEPVTRARRNFIKFYANP